MKINPTTLVYTNSRECEDGQSTQTHRFFDPVTKQEIFVTDDKFKLADPHYIRIEAVRAMEASIWKAQQKLEEEGAARAAIRHYVDFEEGYTE